MVSLLTITKVELPHFSSIMFLFVGTSKTPVVDTNATTFATQDFDDGFDSHYRQG